MKYVFQFGRIIAVCFLGEALSALLPLPFPASVYGLVLLFAALKTGIIRVDEVRETARFLVGILPLFFVPAAAGVMELKSELCAMLLPCAVAVVPVTLLVMGVTGRVTQFAARRGAGGAGRPGGNAADGAGRPGGNAEESAGIADGNAAGNAAERSR